ncbi:hypothetical protein ACWC91_38345 [Streptomyces sp. NPDC001204]
MNAPWPNARPHRLFQVRESGCSQEQWLGVHPAQTPPHTPRAGHPAQVAMQVTGGELRLAVYLLPFDPPAVAAATGDELTCEAWLCRPPVHAWSGKTRCAARVPAPTAAAQERAARIAEADMRADAFEGVV